MGSILNIRRPCKYQNWLPPKDIENLLTLSDFDIIRSDSYLMAPKYIPLISTVFNYFLSLLSLFRLLNLVNLVIARPIASRRDENDLSVSVVVPCRNESGNISEAVKRIPAMGRKTEIIFVDGNSTDGTVEEIE